MTLVETTLSYTPDVSAVDVAGAKLALVIPTLCEAANIRELLDHVRAELDPMGIPYEILVVDDESCDGTAEVVEEVTWQDPRVRLLVRKGERGLAGAVLHGWRHTDADVLGVMDADLQHPAWLLPALVDSILDDHDLVIGSRYAPGGNAEQWNAMRKLVSSAAVWMTWPLQKPELRAKDPMSGFFFVRRRCLDEICFQKTGFKLLLEILVRGRVGSMLEIPFEFGRRRRGESKASLRVVADFGRLLFRLYLCRCRTWSRRWRMSPAETLPTE